MKIAGKCIVAATVLFSSFHLNESSIEKKTVRKLQIS